jgi:hypothetical protein
MAASVVNSGCRADAAAVAQDAKHILARQDREPLLDGRRGLSSMITARTGQRA